MRNRIRTAVGALIAATVLSLAGCPTPIGYHGIQIQQFIPFTRNCAPTIDLTRVRIDTGLYDVRSWELGSYPYRLGIVIQNVLLPSANLVNREGEGNYRQVAGIKVTWTPPAGWGRGSVSSVIPSSIYLNPQQRFGGFFNAMDERIARQILQIYQDAEAGAPCDPTIDTPTTCVFPDKLAPFRVSVALKLIGPNGDRWESNDLSFTVNVCKNCLYQPRPPTQALCCSSPFKVESLSAQQAYSAALTALTTRDICNPFQDNDRMNVSWTVGGYYDVLKCDTCACADEIRRGPTDDRPFCIPEAAPTTP